MVDNIRGVNNTIPHESNINRPKINDKSVIPFDIIDPSKVTRPTKQDPSQETNKHGFGNNQDSVIEKFIQTLNLSPVLSESIKKMLLNKQFVNVNIKKDPILSLLFESFMKNIEMDSKEVLEFLKFQENSYTKFQGDFFSNLRELLQSNSDNEDLKSIIGNFLKSYDCFISADKTLNSIASILKNIDQILPPILKESYNSMTKDLILLNTQNSVDLNLKLLKTELLPFLGKYIATTNDFGSVRDYVSVLIHNIVNLENGLKDNFSSSIDTLFNYMKYNLFMDDKDLNKMRQDLITNTESNSDSKNSCVDNLFKMIKSGTTESDSLINKTSFQNVNQSLLFNHSIQIPLMHMFLPLNFGGNLMFSEMWIEKNIEKDTKKSTANGINKDYYKIFVTFDIDNVGYFETIMLLVGDKLSMEILVPDNLKKYSDKIRNEIGDIIRKNNLTISQVSVNECVQRRRFYEVFNNIFERNSGVNVVI